MFLSLILVTIAVPLVAESDYIPDPLATLDNKQEMQEWVKLEAKHYNVPASLMTCLINHEDTSWNPLKQSEYVSNNVREDSWGLSQINLPSHNDVTKEQAQNPKFAITWMASELSKGNASMWSTLVFCK